ncbi:glutathione S-transferase [Bibersteinia trehalosi]|nr:glutathione S-transferase [Bibersteinia trehalosi]
MLTLYTVAGGGKIRSASPFAWKAEALLRLAGVPFEKEIAGDFSQMPKGKVPVLKDGDELIADSHVIAEHLQTKYGLNLDRALTAEQKAVGHAFARMAEEHLYWAGVYNRFIDPIGKPFIMTAMFDGMPAEQAEAIFAALQEKSLNQLKGHGIGLHSQSDVYRFAMQDLDAISDYLGEKAYLFGDEISSADVAVVPVVAGLIFTPIDTEIAEYARSKTNLAAYAERFDQAVFGG